MRLVCVSVTWVWLDKIAHVPKHLLRRLLDLVQLNREALILGIKFCYRVGATQFLNRVLQEREEREGVTGEGRERKGGVEGKGRVT